VTPVSPLESYPSQEQSQLRASDGTLRRPSLEDPQHRAAAEGTPLLPAAKSTRRRTAADTLGIPSAQQMLQAKEEPRPPQMPLEQALNLAGTLS